MPSILTKSRELEHKFLRGAPKGNKERIQEVIDIYKSHKNVNFLTTQNMVLALYSPSLYSKLKVDKMYENFISKHADTEAFPGDHIRTWRYADRMKERLDRLTGVKRHFQLEVYLYTQERKMDPTRDYPKQEELPKNMKKILGKKHKGLIQFWKGSLSVEATNSTAIEELKWKMTTRGTKEFRQLYPICKTDPNFAARERLNPGYLDGIYIKDWTDMGKVKRPARDPLHVQQRAAGDKAAIQFRYTSNELDLNKRTFREALQKNNHHQSECWINSIYDHYGETTQGDKRKGLLDPDKRPEYRITRESILELLGRTEDNIKEGLSIEEVLPFFQKYKLKLRVYDVFYNQIYKYDPEVPNFHEKPFYCITDGDHIYTLNKDLESLAQKTDDEDYKVVAGADFRTPDKPVKSDHKIIEHIDELIAILESSNDEENLTYLVQKYDNLEAIVWQLYKAGHRPSIKDGAGSLSWVSLTVNKHTFVIKSQQMIDWAIDGMMEIQDATTFNRMHDAKMDFHYQLFRKEHKSYYNSQDLDILNECRTVANVGWLKELPQGNVIIPKVQTRTAFSRTDLAEIDITKAFTGAFMKIKAIPVFNEFDTWQPYADSQPLKDLSLYMVEAKELDMFFNKRYCLCYGVFLKQLGKPKIHAVKHPSFIKKVSYRQMVEDLWKTPISDDAEEDSTLKKTIANCNFGMLEKQINKSVKSKIFDTYEDAKWFQAKYGGTISIMKQYEERQVSKCENPIDNGVEEVENECSTELIPTGNCLFILSLSAECSLTNGYRYIKELLMQHHNFYLNKCQRILTQHGIDVHVSIGQATLSRKVQEEEAVASRNQLGATSILHLLRALV